MMLPSGQQPSSPVYHVPYKQPFRECFPRKIYILKFLSRFFPTVFSSNASLSLLPLIEAHLCHTLQDPLYIKDEK
jgi:hypothetical protein